jgi:hypothetical protein
MTPLELAMAVMFLLHMRRRSMMMLVRVTTTMTMMPRAQPARERSAWFETFH